MNYALALYFKQEKFIARHKNILNVPVSLGVGAAFDFVAGTQKRAPRWMQEDMLKLVEN